MEGMSSGVTVIGAEAPSAYHVAPRTENPNQNPNQVTGSLSMVTSPMGLGMVGSLEKKKRGRPRKYGPDGSSPGSVALSPVPISSSAPPFGNHSTGKRGRGRPAGSENKQQKKMDSVNIGELTACSVGSSFMPHVITVNAGEDVTMKVISFSQQGPRAICILSANGVISNVTLGQPGSSGGTLTYEGIFEILSLSGSFMPTETQGTRSRSGGMSVSLVSPDGRVVGGMVAGLLIAASPVQVVVGSFLTGTQQEPKHKRQPKTDTAPEPTVAAPEKEQVMGGFGDSGAQTPDLSSPSSIERESWMNMHHSMQDSRKSATDINISLPGG